MQIRKRERKARVIPKGQKCNSHGCCKKAVTFYNKTFVCQEHFEVKQKKTKEYNNKKNPTWDFEKYYIDNKKTIDKASKRIYEQNKIVAIERGKKWYHDNKEKLEKLPWKNKKKVMKLIDEYYTGNNGQNLIFEAYFNVVLIDILNLQGCDFVNQFPFQGRVFDLQPRRVDGYCRKYKIPLETKCCYFWSSAQKELKNQIPEYLEFFKVKPLVISPEGYQEDTLDLYEGCKKVLKMIKTV